MKYKKLLLTLGLSGILLSLNSITNIAFGAMGVARECKAGCHWVSWTVGCVYDNGGGDCNQRRQTASARAATTNATKPSVVTNTNNKSEPQSQNKIASGGIRIVRCSKGCSLATESDGFLVQPYKCVDNKNVDCGAATTVSGNVTPQTQKQNYEEFILSELVVNQTSDAI